MPHHVLYIYIRLVQSVGFIKVSCTIWYFTYSDKLALGRYLQKTIQSEKFRQIILNGPSVWKLS